MAPVSPRSAQATRTGPGRQTGAVTRLQSMMLSSAVFSFVTWAGFALFAPDARAPDPSLWATVSGPELRVAFGGIGDRAPLRYRPEAGARSRRELWMMENGRSEAGPELLTDSTWEARLAVDCRVREIGADGSIRFTWQVDDVEVLRADSKGRLPGLALREALEALDGLEGESLLDERGLVLSSSTKGGGSPGALGPALRVAVERILAEPVPPLPVEPLGERAEWDVRRTTLDGGARTEWTERWKLLEEQPGRWGLQATLVGEGEAPRVGLPGGGEAGVATHEGSGAWSLDLRTLAMEGEGTARSEGRSSILLGPAPVEILSSSSSELRLRPR